MTSDDQSWGAIRLLSEAGTWYIARTPAIKKALESGSRKAPRAVFSRGELHAALPGLKAMKPKERQEWLSSMIELKKNLKGARIENIKVHDGRVSLSPNNRSYD
tara:strand:- start:888 stop:1199 length:312 start_codon:yes stop_codon:yes gene_type:complete